MSAKPVWLWWSSGKDSAWTLEVLRREGREVRGLVTTIRRDVDRVAMHAVRSELLRAQARAAGVPLHGVELPFPCTNEQYEAAVRPVIGAARAAGVASMAFGDLFLEDIRAYRERLLERSGIEPIFPIFGRDTGALAREMIEAGLRAVVTCVDSRAVPRELAGRDYDEAFLRDLPSGADPCGENGEFHTFTCAGPMFASEIPVTRGEIVERDGFVFADLLLARDGPGG